jgi:hypothetical protein
VAGLSVSEIYKYYEDLFCEFQPYYKTQFDIHAKELSFSYDKIAINIDVEEWNFQARVSRVNNNYIINISKGLFIRLVILINCLIRPKIDFGLVSDNAFVIKAYDFLYKNPDKSVYDYIENDDLRAEVLPVLHPILFDYTSKKDHEFEMDKFWSGVFLSEEIKNKHTTIPFFWVLDFIIYHEMSHVLLRHLEFVKKEFNENTISERGQFKGDVLKRKRYIESHADHYAAQILARSLPTMNYIGQSAEDRALIKENMYNLAFLLNALFIFWGQHRKSVRFHKNMSHPHPDFRRRIFDESIVMFLSNSEEAVKVWHEEVINARIDIHKAFNRIGAPGLEYSIFQLVSSAPPDTAKEWIDKTEEEYKNFKNGLSEFSHYMTRYYKR